MQREISEKETVGAAPPKRRGRPPGSKNKPTETPQVAIPTEALEPLLAFPFDYVANRRGDHWRLTETERKNLAKLAETVCTKYGEWFAKFGPELSLSLYLSLCIGSRMLTDRQLAQKAAETEAAMNAN